MINKDKIAALRSKAEAGYYNPGHRPSMPVSPFGPTGSDPRAVRARELKAEAHAIERELVLEAVAAYGAKKDRLLAEWNADRIEAFDLAGHPKAQDIIDRAESAAHDFSGETDYGRIVDETQNIMELLS